MSPTRRSEIPSSSAPIRSRADSTITLEAHIQLQRAFHPRAAAGAPILQLLPTSPQQRTPAMLGSPAEVEQVLRHLQ